MKLTKDLLDIFEEIVIEHPLFNLTVTPILTHIQLGSRGRISMIVGPTGVGKTTLIRFCEKRLCDYIRTNPHCEYSVPLVLEALSPESGNFNWKDFYTNALRKMHEPGIDAKVDLDACVSSLISGKKAVSYRGMTQYQLRALFEQAVQTLNPIVIFIDEIQHITKCPSIVRKTDNLDVIKSLSNTTSTSFILAGTYEARSMMYYGGQLSRRVNVIHFKRYHQEDDGIKIFSQIIKSIIKEYDIPISNEILKNIKYLYNHSLGCVGILMTWFHEATGIAITEKCKTLKINHFKSTRLNNIQLSAILNEIQSFEIEHEDDSDFKPTSILNTQSSNEKNSKNTTVKHNLKPGVRKPCRDPLPTF